MESHKGRNSGINGVSKCFSKLLTRAAEVTVGGKLFQMWAAATSKARSQLMDINSCQAHSSKPAAVEYGRRTGQTDGHRSVLQTLLRTLFGQCQVPITNIYVLTHSLFLHWLRMNVSWQQRMSLQYPPKVVFFICNQTPATIRYRHRLVNNDVKQPTGRWKTTNWTVVDQTRINHSMSSTAVKS